MRFIRFIFIFLFLGSLLLVSCTHQTDKSKEESYSIGLNLTLSGNASYFGSEVFKGLEMAIRDGEKKHNCSFKLIVEDNRFMPQEAVGITKKFQHILKPHLMIAGYTNMLQPVIPLVESGNIPMIATLASSVGLAEGQHMMVRDFALESQLMPLLAKYMYQVKGLRNGSYVVVNDDFGHDSRDYFKETFEQLGGTFEGGVVFNENDLDLRSLISKALSVRPQFLLIVGRGAGMNSAIRQARELAPEVVICGSNSFDNEKAFESLGAEAEGLVFVNFSFDKQNPLYYEVSERFFLKHNHRMNWLNIVGYSLGEYSIDALLASDGNPEKLLNYIRTYQLNTIRGKLQVNDFNDVVSPIGVFERKNNQSIQVYKSN
jgi:branched-chain amino acid transport system substrate-binding protein